MDALSPWHLILLLIVALLVLGPGKLPQAGSALGKALKEFRDAVDGREASGAPGGGSPAMAAPPEPPASATARPSGTNGPPGARDGTGPQA